MFRRVACAAFLAVVLSAGCSEPPNAERHQAEGAIAAARAADAATYAGEALKSAEAALAKYDAAVAQRDYRQALSLAIEARDTAYEAVKQAGDEKAALRSQAEHLAAELDSLTRLAAAKGPAALKPVPDHPRTDLKAAATALQEARTLLAQNSYGQVVATLTPIVEQLRKELGQPAPAPGRRGR